MTHPRLVMVVLWLLFGVSWIAAALWRSKTERRLGMRQELGHRLLLIAGIVLLTLPARGPHNRLLWFIPPHGAWGLVILMFAGLSFCWYARLHLGALWSGTITAKSDHSLVDTGPYGMVRHPIYTGLIVAFIATLLANGSLAGLVGTALVVLSFWIKAGLEETWLGGVLGQDIYDEYRRRVPMLVPFGPKRGR